MYPFGGPNNKDLGSILGSPYFGKLPHNFMGTVTDPTTPKSQRVGFPAIDYPFGNEISTSWPQNSAHARAFVFSCFVTLWHITRGRPSKMAGSTSTYLNGEVVRHNKLTLTTNTALTFSEG